MGLHFVFFEGDLNEGKRSIETIGNDDEEFNIFCLLFDIASKRTMLLLLFMFFSIKLDFLIGVYPNKGCGLITLSILEGYSIV